jgi:hypothetical protein
MPPRNKRRKQPSTSLKEDGDDSDLSNEHETEGKKKVRWEQTMDEEEDCNDLDEDSAGLDKVVSPALSL